MGPRWGRDCRLTRAVLAQLAAVSAARATMRDGTVTVSEQTVQLAPTCGDSPGNWPGG